MNPFKVAKQFGYGADELLNFAAKAIPGFEDKIKYALAAGYSADELLKFLQNAFADGKSLKNYAQKSDATSLTEQISRRGTDTEKQLQASIKNKRLGSILNPDKLLSAAGGAAIGGLAGGPMGAIGGAVGGLETYDDLLRKYEQHIAGGGQQGLQDFLQSVVKGGAKGVGVAGMGEAAQRLFQALQKQGTPEGEEELQAEESGQAPPESPPEGEVVQEQTVEEVVPEQEAIDKGQESYEVLKSLGAGNLVDRLSGSVNPDEGFRAMRNLFGNQWLKDIKKKTGRDPEAVIKEAFEFAKSGKSAETSPETIEKSVTEEAEATPESVEAETEQKITVGEDPKADMMRSIFEGASAQPQAQGKSQRKPKPIANALKSSNVRGAFYDADKKKMRVVFGAKPGSKEPAAVYSYDNVDQKAFNDMVGGKAKPLTEGENKFGLWFNEKNPSVGAAFSKFIKKNADKYPYEKVGKEDYTLEEKQISEADRTFLASDLFEPFKKVREQGRRIKKASELQGILPALKQVDEEFLSEIIEYVEDKIGLKNPPTVKRLKKEIEKEFL